MATATEQPFLTLAEVAKTVRIGRTTAYALVKRGEIPAIRIGGQIRVPRAWVEAQAAEAISAVRETAP